MLDTRLSAFLGGILEFAADGSAWVGHSCLGVSAYTAAGWQKAFRRHYHVRPFKTVEADESFFQALGEPVRVLRAEDTAKLTEDLSSCNGGIGAYWFTDGVFFVEFKTHVLAFLSGTFD